MLVPIIPQLLQRGLKSYHVVILYVKGIKTWYMPWQTPIIMKKMSWPKRNICSMCAIFRMNFLLSFLLIKIKIKPHIHFLLTILSIKKTIKTKPHDFPVWMKKTKWMRSPKCICIWEIILNSTQHYQKHSSVKSIWFRKVCFTKWNTIGKRI